MGANESLAGIRSCPMAYINATLSIARQSQRDGVLIIGSWVPKAFCHYLSSRTPLIRTSFQTITVLRTFWLNLVGLADTP